MRYPASLASPFVFEMSPLAVASRSDDFPLEYLGARSLRAYDRGECSSAIPWRQIGDAFAAGLDKGIQEKAEQIFLFGVDEACRNDPNCVTGGTALKLCPIPTSGYQITPLLRDGFAGPRDAFVFTRSYALRLCAGIGQVRVRVQFSGRFEADEEGRLGFRLLWVTAQDPGGETKAVVEDPLRKSLESTVNDQIASVIRQPVVDDALLPRGISCNLNDDDADASCLEPVQGALGVSFGIPADGVGAANVSCEEFDPSQTGAACHLAPNVYRVNHRPDGVEVVLSEVEPFDLEGREADPLFPLLLNEAFCERFPAETAIETCYMDTVFEIPPSTFPEVCGDALME